MSKRSVKKAIFRVEVTLPAGTSLKQAEDNLRIRLGKVDGLPGFVSPQVKLTSHETVYL